MASASGCSASTPSEHPVALQLGGSDPAKLAEAARIGEAFGYDEINLNCRLPVRPRAVGHVRRLPDADAGAGRRLRRRDEGARCAIPVTVKCRIGVDDQDPEVALDALADGCLRGRRRRALGACAQGLAAKGSRPRRTAISRRSTTTASTG